MVLSYSFEVGAFEGLDTKKPVALSKAALWPPPNSHSACEMSFKRVSHQKASSLTSHLYFLNRVLLR